MGRLRRRRVPRPLRLELHALHRRVGRRRRGHLPGRVLPRHAVPATTATGRSPTSPRCSRTTRRLRRRLHAAPASRRPGSTTTATTGLDLYLANDFVGPSPGSQPAVAQRRPRRRTVEVHRRLARLRHRVLHEHDGDRRSATSTATATSTSRSRTSPPTSSCATTARHVRRGAAAGDRRPLQQAASSRSRGAGASTTSTSTGGRISTSRPATSRRASANRSASSRTRCSSTTGRQRRSSTSARPTGADDPGDSKGVAFADYDRDGDMDIFVVEPGRAAASLRERDAEGVEPLAGGRHRRHGVEPGRMRRPADADGPRTDRSSGRSPAAPTSVGSGSERDGALRPRPERRRRGSRDPLAVGHPPDHSPTSASTACSRSRSLWHDRR